MKRDSFGMKDKLRTMVQHIGPILLAGYLTLAIKWYPGWVDSRLSFQEPLRVLLRGFVEDWPIVMDGPPIHVSRPAWALFLIPIIGFGLWAFFRFYAGRLSRFVGRCFVCTFRPKREFAQFLFRALILAVTVGFVYFPWNRAVHHELPSHTITNVILYSLLPLSICVGAIYHGSVYVVRYAAYFMNIFCMPPGQPPAILASAGPSSPYDYGGLGSEILRFLVLAFILILVIGLVTPVISRYRKTSFVILIMLCLSLFVFAVIGIVNPGYLR